MSLLHRTITVFCVAATVSSGGRKIAFFADLIHWIDFSIQWITFLKAAEIVIPDQHSI